MGVGTNRIEDADALLRNVNFAGKAGTPVGRTVQSLTGDIRRVGGLPNLPCRRLLNGHEGIGRPGAGPVAAEREHGAALLQGVPAIGGHHVGGVQIQPLFPAAERGLHVRDDRELGEARYVFGIDEIGMLDSQAAILGAMRFFQPLVRVQYHVHRIGSQRMRHELIAARIQFHHQCLVVMRCIHQRRYQAGAAVGEELHQIRQHPIIVVQPPRLLEVSEKGRPQVMLHGHRAEAGARAHAEGAAVAQRAVQSDLGQITGGVDHAGNAETIQVMRRRLDHGQLFLHGYADGDRAGGQLHGGLEQHTARMAAGIADDAAFFIGVLHRQVRDAGHGEGRAVQPHRMFGGVVNYHRAVRHGLIEQRMGRSAGRHGVEIGTNEQHRVLGVCSRILFELGDQQLRLFRRYARFRRGQVQSMQCKGAVQQVHVRVDDARDDRLSVQVDHL